MGGIRTARRRHHLLRDVAFTVLVSVAFLGLVFVLFAAIWNGWDWPARDSGSGWLRDVAAATVPVAGLVGAAVVVATTFRRHQLELAQDERETTRALRERFTTVANQLGHESPAVRVAGVYAAAALADDWHEQGNRIETQVCINLLCAYLRSPRTEPLEAEGTTWTAPQRAETQVRTTVSGVIASRLRVQAGEHNPAWAEYNINLSGVFFDEGHHDFDGIRVGEATSVSFDGARFGGGRVSFDGAQFTGGEVSLKDAWFSGGDVSFTDARFSGGHVSFRRAQFTGGEVSLFGAQFTGGRVSFDRAEFHENVSFTAARFSGADVSFDGARFSEGVSFKSAWFDGGATSFAGAEFISGTVSFRRAELDGGAMSFAGADFTSGRVSFFDARTEESFEFVEPPWGAGDPPDSWPLRASEPETP